MTSYERDIAAFTSTTNGVDIGSMQCSIYINETISILLLGMRSENDTTYYFDFEAALSGAEETELDVLIVAHIGNPAPLSELDAAVINAKLLIDSAAGEAREKYITIGKGQGATYIEKEKDAQAFKAAGYPIDETDYAYVTAEKNATATTATVAADNVIAISSQWKSINANIEELRIQYKKECSESVDVQTCQALSLKGMALLNAV